MSGRPSTNIFLLLYCVYLKLKCTKISCHILLLSSTWVSSKVESGLMIYLTGRNPGIGLHVIDVHYIWCEYEFLSDARIIHLIHGDKIVGKFGNAQHIIEDSVGEFNPSFADDLD
jgi:hypothetical protein